MGQVLSEDRLAGAGHYLVSEAHGYRSREQVVIAAGAGKLRAGTVLGQLTANKKFTVYDPAASNGAQVAVAILFEGCDATTADVRRTITARHAEVQADVLRWKDGLTDNQKTAGLADLAKLSIAGR